MFLNKELFKEKHILIFDDADYISGHSFIDKTDRTLLYGFTLDRQSHHVYLKNGILYLYIYSGKNIDTIKSGIFTYLRELIPTKRIYPESIDTEFMNLLISKSLSVDFTTYDKERYEKLKYQNFHGDIINE